MMLPFLSFNLLVWTLTHCAVLPLSVRAQLSDSDSFLPLMTESRRETTGIPLRSSASQQEPDFSGTGRPGRQTAGDRRGLCPTFSSHLTALMPMSHWGQTVAEHPTFWFYLPYSPRQTPVGEFVLQDTERNDIYRTTFTVPQTGYLSISIPSETSLAVGQWYQWYFKVYCDSQRDSSPIFVHGWVQRVALNPLILSELKATDFRQDLVFAAHGIWYDALAHLAALRLTYPEIAALEEDWHQLLKAKGVELELPSAEMVGSVKVTRP